MEATLAHLLGSPREGLLLGLVFGEVSTPKGLPGIQAPEAHEKVFRGESDGQKGPKKVNSIIAA